MGARIELPWSGDGPEQETEIAVHGHLIQVVPIDERGLHTGRMRYRTACASCWEVLHPGTTSPGWQIERHLDPHGTEHDMPELDLDRLEAVSRLGADVEALELQGAVRALLRCLKKTEALAERRRKERAQVLNVKSTDGLTSSEWLMRTAKAEAERDAAIVDRNIAAQELTELRLATLRQANMLIDLASVKR